jgi:hypothetical protein
MWIMYKTGTWGEQAKERSKKRSTYFQVVSQSKRVDARQMIIIELGGVCIKCGFNDWRALQVDHVNGGGVAERKALGNWQYYGRLLSFIKESPNKYQLLCANCNWIKRWENQENNKFAKEGS